MPTSPALSRPRHLPSINPFATCNVQPGAIQFRFPEDISADVLANQLKCNGWRAQIIGQHGSGKSTLLKSLVPILESLGREIVLIECRFRQRSLPESILPISRWTPETLFVVDGFEQLSFWARKWFIWKCRKAGCGLLVTAHESCGLLTLYLVDSEIATIQSIVQQLQLGYPFAISSDRVIDLFTEHQGNTRELFFRLYDLYEKERERV